MPSSTRASGRFLAIGQSGQTGKRTVLAHPYFKVRRRQGRKQLEKGPLKETKKGTRLALSKRSQLALFCCSVPELASLTVGQLYLDGPVCYAALDAADEKNREGNDIPLRARYPPN